MAATKPARLSCQSKSGLQRRDRDPALRAQGAGVGGTTLERNQHAADAAAARQGAQDRVGVKRKAGRRLGRGRVAGLVAAAAPQFAQRPTHQITRAKNVKLMPVWYSKPRFSTGSTVTLSPGPRHRARRAPRRAGRARSAPVPGRSSRSSAARVAAAGPAAPSAREEHSPPRRPEVYPRPRPSDRARPAKRPPAHRRCQRPPRCRHQGGQGDVDREMGHADFGEASPATAITSTSAAGPAAPMSPRPPVRSGARGASRPFDPQYLAGIAQAQRPRRAAAGSRRYARSAGSCPRAARPCGARSGPSCERCLAIARRLPTATSPRIRRAAA